MGPKVVFQKLDRKLDTLGLFRPKVDFSFEFSIEF